MMKVLKSFEFPESASRSGKHDWNALCDGAIRELTKGQDFSGKKKWFAVQCRTQAKKRGMKVRLSGHSDESHDKLVVQFVPINGEEQQQPPTGKGKK